MTKPTGKPEGRPPLFPTVEDLELKIEQYFIDGMTKRKVITGPPNNKSVEEIPVPTITGLALYLGFADRRSMYDYEDKPEFSHTIKKARAAIEQCYEEQLQTGNPVGAIFALKNFGWKDRLDLTTGDRPLPIMGGVSALPTDDSVPEDSGTSEAS